MTSHDPLEGWTGRVTIFHFQWLFYFLWKTAREEIQRFILRVTKLQAGADVGDIDTAASFPQNRSKLDVGVMSRSPEIVQEIQNSTLKGNSTIK